MKWKSPSKLAAAAALLLLPSCAGIGVKDGDFAVAIRANVGVLTQVQDNGAGTLALGTGPGNGVQVGRQVLEVEGSQPAEIEITTPSGGRVIVRGTVSQSAVDEAAGSAINRGLRTKMIGGAIRTVTGGVVDMATEAIDKIE